MKARANPFDKAAVGAKIPDAKSTVSAALRFQSVNEVAGESNKQELIVFFPGLSNCVSYHKNLGTANDLTPIPAAATDAGLFDSAPAPRADVASNVISNYSAPTTPIEKWRIVSAGLRVQLVNNADENDGWFEAIRIEPGYTAPDLENFKFRGLKDVTQKVLPVCYGGANDATNLYPTTWANHPTYVTGKLRDIHQYMWKLNSLQKDHDYMNALNDASTPIIDTNYDVVMIRVHTRDSTDSGSTKLVLHQCVNYEMVFETGTLMSATSTRTWGGGLTSRGDRVAPAGSAGNRRFGYSGFRRSYRRTYKRKTPVRRTYKRKTTTRRSYRRKK